MKYIDKLSVKIVVAIVIGFLFASVLTHVTYPCAAVNVPAGESAANCVSYEKAIMHPTDLMNNKQDSLVHFAETIAVVSLVSFALFAASCVWLRKTTRKP